jgi:hypothetical protein
MKHLLRTGLAVAIAGLLSGQGAIQPIPIPQQVATNTFTPLTLYFVDPVSGSDGANGLSVANAWKTPNHAVHCGDVLLVKPGSYRTGQLSFTFGAVSNCPSMTGGIDGQGGIYFAILLCAGALTTCNVTAGGGVGNPAIGLGGSSYWAVEGFTIPNVTGHRGIEMRIVGSCAQLFSIHHLAAINNVIYNSDQAIGVNDGGCVIGSNPPALDYIAAVGNIAQDAAQDGICLGAIDFVGTGATDGVTTAIKGYMAGNFSWHNRNTGCDAKYDNQGLMFDTLDAHSSNGIWVAENNMAWDNGRYGFQLFWQCSTTQAFTVNIANNTLYANNAGAVTQGLIAGELNISSSTGSCPQNPIPVTVNLSKNIALAKYATSPTTGFANIYALVFDANGTTTHWTATNGQTGTENIYKGQRSSCNVFNGGGCDAGFNINWANSTNLQGTNFFTDPLFASATDLLANWVGAPNCAGFETATQCMGWNASTKTLTTLTPISDLQASCTNCGGKGYQLPSITCAANANYPTWLKGINYLHALDGFVANSRIQEKSGLHTKPCGM